jgi:CBS domain-containing protein
MPTAHDILRNKGSSVHSVRPSDTVLTALSTMAEHDVGAVLVIERGEVVGVLSERDYARKVALVGRSSRDSPVSAIMTTDVVAVAPQRSIEECMALMTQRRIRHLPVIENRRLVGVISIGDLVKAMIDEQEFTIRELKSYIAS